MYGEEKMAGLAKATPRPSAMFIDKTNELRMILSDIAERLVPITQPLPKSENRTDKIGSDVLLQRELDELIEQARYLRDSIAL